jgi:hypothetical protein
LSRRRGGTPSSARRDDVGSGRPSHQLLFAGLLLADTLSDRSATPPPAAPAEPAKASPAADESDTLAALTRLAERIEALGDSLAAELTNA